MVALREKITSALIAARYDQSVVGTSPWKCLLRRPRNASPSPIILPPPINKQLRTRMYEQLAVRYEANSRQPEALETRQAAARMNGAVDLDDGSHNTPIGFT